MIRKIKRNMARNQFKDDDRRHINKRVKMKGAPSGKTGSNSSHSLRQSNSDFSYSWKQALKRRVKHFEELNRRKKAGAK